MDLVQLYAVWVDEFIDPPIGNLVYLSDDEFRRAAAITRADRRAQFLAGRYVLRNVLASMLGIPAHKVPIKYSSSGRLEVCDIHCTLSHSRGLAVVAVSRTYRLGIDVQHVRPRLCVALAKQLGWHAIAEWMIDRSPLEQATVFTRMWARSEALFKALELSGLPFGRTDWTAPFVDLHHGCRVLMSPIGRRVSINDLILHSDYSTALVTYPPLDIKAPPVGFKWLESRVSLHSLQNPDLRRSEPVSCQTQEPP